MSHKRVFGLENDRAAWGFAKKENVKLKVDPSTLIRHLISRDGTFHVISPKKLSSSQKKTAVAPVSGSKSKPLVVCLLKRMRDAYVSLMMSLAASKNFSMAGAAIVMGPCCLDQAQYPGRRPKTDPTADELELARAAKKLENGRTVSKIARPAACARKAIFPL